MEQDIEILATSVVGDNCVQFVRVGAEYEIYTNNKKVPLHNLTFIQGSRYFTQEVADMLEGLQNT